jgi:hypothetical protein
MRWREFIFSCPQCCTVTVKLNPQAEDHGRESRSSSRGHVKIQINNNLVCKNICEIKLFYSVYRQGRTVSTRQRLVARAGRRYECDAHTVNRPGSPTSFVHGGGPDTPSAHSYFNAPRILSSLSLTSLPESLNISNGKSEEQWVRAKMTREMQ